MILQWLEVINSYFGVFLYDSLTESVYSFVVRSCRFVLEDELSLKSCNGENCSEFCVEESYYNFISRSKFSLIVLS